VALSQAQANNQPSQAAWRALCLVSSRWTSSAMASHCNHHKCLPLRQADPVKTIKRQRQAAGLHQTGEHRQQHGRNAQSGRLGDKKPQTYALNWRYRALATP
jgi:hypothetical protein